MKTQLLRATFILAALLIAANGAISRAGVSTESPFAPRGLSAAGPVANNTPIELRGIVSDEQGARFAIYDPVKKEGTWVRLDEKGQSFVVRSHDAATNRIVVDYQGKSQTIVLVEPKFGPGKAVAGAAPMPGMAPQAGAVPVQGVQRFAAPSAASAQGATQQRTQQQSADEAKRLEAIRAEVARRRAQRESGSQQGQPQQ